MLIRTFNQYDRQTIVVLGLFPWAAIDQDTYKQGDPIGYGDSEIEAVDDLLYQIKGRPFSSIGFSEMHYDLDDNPLPEKGRE